MLRLNNLKPGTTMNAKISVLVICVKAIIYLLLYNLHDCPFKEVVYIRRVAKGRGGGGGLPLTFSKIGKSCSNLGKKCPDCGQLWVKCLI